MHYGKFLVAKIFRIRARTLGIPKNSGLYYWMSYEIRREYHKCAIAHFSIFQRARPARAMAATLSARTSRLVKNVFV